MVFSILSAVSVVPVLYSAACVMYMSHVAEQTLCLDDDAHTPVSRVWIVDEIDFVLLNLWVGMFIVYWT